MRLSKNQIERLVQKIFIELKRHDIVTFKEDESKCLAFAMAKIEADYAREAELDKEVNRMLDDLERKNSGEFSRYKMFPMLKKKLAKDKKVPI